MKKIGIVGSGRWARVTIKILNNIFCEKIRFIIFTNYGIKQIKSWIFKENFKNNYFQVVKYDQIYNKLCDAYIVINAPKDHFKISKNIISLGKPIFIEKPISLSKSDVKKLIDLSNKKKIILGTSNIFLFAEYILNFKELISTYQNISSIQFIWSDPQNESRYGELKKYDPSLAIHKDVLPHILSIVFYLFESHDASIKDICFLKGGSNLEINLTLDDKIFHIALKRNSQKRERIIKIFDKDLILMDFSKEPGKIEVNSKEEILDSQWNNSESPASKMYRIFFNSLYKNDLILDPRIRPSEEIYSLIDDIDALYVQEQEHYIKNTISNQRMITDDFNYCIKEFFLAQSLASYNDVEIKVDKFIKLIKNKKINIKSFLTHEPSAFIKNLRIDKNE